jgi:3-hydroxyisobutyrate dehydrogenase-like beta-hydroxyacid dehydrogenase
LERTEIAAVGLLGAGRMGAPLGRHLLAAGTRLAVFDPSDEAVRALADRGAVPCAGAAQVAARSDLVLVVVVDDAQVREAVGGCLEVARPGTVIAICASVRPDTCRELASAGAERGVDVIDTALVRGERGAEAGELVLFCGGPAEVIDRIRPVCEPFAEAVVHVGDVGAGQVAKTVNNILLWACIRADVEALRLGRALGVEPARLRDAMALGSGANRPLAEWGKHRLRWPQKDLEVALAIAADAGVDVPFAAALPRLMEELSVDELRELL